MHFFRWFGVCCREDHSITMLGNGQAMPNRLETMVAQAIWMPEPRSLFPLVRAVCQLRKFLGCLQVCLPSLLWMVTVCATVSTCVNIANVRKATQISRISTNQGLRRLYFAHIDLLWIPSSVWTCLKAPISFRDHRVCPVAWDIEQNSLQVSKPATCIKGAASNHH